MAIFLSKSRARPSVYEEIRLVEPLTSLIDRTSIFPYDCEIRKEFGMTTEVTLTSKGQITLPKELRTSLGLEAGAKLAFTQLSDGTGTVVMRVKHRKLSELAGLLTRPGQPSVPLEDLSR